MYWGKFYIEYYHFCQQYKDYFETFGATGMNYILFAALFFCGFINIR